MLTDLVLAQLADAKLEDPSTIDLSNDGFVAKDDRIGP